ncbi:synaptic vesicular amine transporter-like isoform X4 [Branchiostoma floridae]|uniref:Synaptic vesicular amine transporter-like isoform X4 n=1 Tax=Branchiostoma floridae TaxID=7739 RepID=A0A9J7N199_BRAFL|nr:synaptic vesicular amine transporter-like isoform X4 [Branchiostoma floridae]
MIHKALPTLSNFRKSGALVLIVAFLAMFVDTMLTTVIRPIMPDYLYRLEHPNFTGAIITNPQRVKQLEKLSVKLGILYAASPAASIITNPVSAWLADRFGYTLILYIGMVLVFFSTIAFTFSTSFAKLFAARAVQGIGGSFSVIAAFMMLAMTFKDTDRAKAIGFSQSGMTIGLLVGPAIGGAMYESLGYKSPFLLIAGVTVVDGVLRLLQQRPAEEKSKENAEEYSSLNLLKDPYVLLAAAFIFVGIATAMMVGGMVPVWLMISMNASAWQQGVAILPQSVGYIIGSILSPVLVGKAGRAGRNSCANRDRGVSGQQTRLEIRERLRYLRNRHRRRHDYWACGLRSFDGSCRLFLDDARLRATQRTSQSCCHPTAECTKYRKEGQVVNRLQGGEPAEDTVLQTSTWGGFLRIK